MATKDYIGEILRRTAQPVVNAECPNCHHGFQVRPPIKLVATGEWFPIETAPLDETRILIWDGKEVSLVWWRWKYRSEPGEPDESYGTWDAGGISGFNATHWMPLPPHPNQERGE